jgi:SAM-dependent methyltransferase
MTPEQVRQLYDAKYAAEYDDKFLNAELARPDTEFEIATLDQLLSGRGPWLDLACGTGYFLSLFPHIERAGLDISPAMIARATARNPGVPFHPQSYLDPMPEWRDRWKLVSCMWYAYGLVSSMAEVGRLVDNMADWTAPDGVCFVPLCDPTLVSGVPIPYEIINSPWPGRVFVTGITWSYFEGAHSRHEDMIAPHVTHMLSLFRDHFEQLDLITYPSTRQALIARKKRNKS